MSLPTSAESRRGTPLRVGPQAGDADRAALRARHQVSLVPLNLEGTGLDAQPGGIYGYTYAPALPNAPVFQHQPYRAFEVHKRADGGAFIVGFVPASVAGAIAAGAALDLQIHPHAEGDADTLVAVPTTRIRRHRQHTGHTEPGLFMEIGAGC